MQENSFIGYVRIKSLKAPAPMTERNSRGDSLYSLQASGISICGSTRDQATNSFITEARELDLYFVKLSTKQAELLSVDAEIFINGANVVTFDAPVVYAEKNFNELHDGVEGPNIPNVEIADFLTRAVVLAYPEKDSSKVSKQLLRLLPEKRRKTVLRIGNTNWTLKASSKQIATAQSIDDMEDVSAA